MPLDDKSRRQIVFDWIMEEPGYWGGTDDVAKVDALLAALDQAAPSATLPNVKPGRWYFVYESDSEKDAQDRRIDALAWGDLNVGAAVSAIRRSDGSTANNAAPQEGAGSSAGPATNGEPAAAAPNEDFDLEEFNTLAKFYNVRTLSDLVRIQAEHIEKLQAKLPKTPPFPGVNRVREG